MAVTIKQKQLTVKSLAEKLMPASLNSSSTVSKATQLHDAGAELVVSITRFGIKWNNGHIIGKTSLKLEAVKLCIQNKLGAAPTKVIRGKLDQAV